MKLLYTTLSIATIGILVGCGPKSETTENKKNDSLGVVDTTAKTEVPPAPEKVLLTAKGTEPFWSLTIGEKLIKFKLADKDTVTASDYKMADNSTPDKEVYIGGKDFGITVENKPTRDAATGATYQKDVTISFQGKKYKGVGGTELSTPGNGSTKPESDTKTEPAKGKAERYTVNGEWVLATLNGKKATTRDFANGKATININTVDKRATGFGGCNRINGEVAIFDGTKIKFDKMISTKMFCEGVKENDYLTALRNATDFAIVGGNLQLKANGAILATFVRPAE